VRGSRRVADPIHRRAIMPAKKKAAKKTAAKKKKR